MANGGSHQERHGPAGDGKRWWKMANSAVDDYAVIDIFGDIGMFDYSAEMFVAELRQVTASRIDVHLSSNGGDVFDGLLIYQSLLDHPADVTVHVDSLAASIASVIAQAGDRVIMAGNAQMMIHDAIGWCNGQASDMRQTADLLDRASDNIAAIYATRAGRGTARSWRKAMVADGLMGTWMGAEEAVAAGLADEISKAGSRNAVAELPLAEPPRTFVPAARIAACAQILDQIEAAFEEDDEDEDDEEQAEQDHVADCDKPADGCDCPVVAAADDGEEAVTDQATTPPPAEPEIDEGAIEAALAGSPLLGHSALLAAAAEVFEPDIELLEACLELAAKDAVRVDPEALSRGAASFRPATDFLVHALEGADIDAARRDAARAAASFEPDGQRLAASLDDSPAFPRTGQTDQDPLTDLQRRTRSLLEAMQ